VLADEVAASMTSLWRELVPHAPAGRLLRQGRAAAVITGIPAATLNTIWLERPDARAGDVGALLDELSATGLPCSLGLRPAADAALARLAVARGLAAVGELPLMAADTASSAVTAAAPAGLSIRRLGPDEAPLHAAIAAVGFGVDQAIAQSLVNPGMLRLDSVRGYVGEAGGRPVATSLGVTIGAFTAIFNVATLPVARGLGYGTALTARAVSDGLAAGAAGCWLQSSPDGYGIYQKLGFHTVEAWPYYAG
jgi:N-acetylglutamate synthase